MITRNKNESILQYYSRIKDMINSKEIDLDKSEIYNLMFGEVVTSDYARRAFRNFDLLIEADSLISNETNNDNETIQSKSIIEINKDGSQSSSKLVKMSENDSKNTEFLLKAHGYDEKWEIISAKSSIWNTNSKNNGVLELYSSKIVVKPKEYGINLEKIEKWYSKFESKKIDFNKYDKNKYDENCLIIPIADLHFNLLCSTFISGNEYNKEIAIADFYKVINEVYVRTENRNISKVILVLGNDMFNANGIDGTTFKGTPQTEQGHIFEAFIELSEVVINAIEFLSKYYPVDIIFVPSNHDKEIAWHFMVNINTYFRNNKNISVDYSPLPRKYYKFGNTLFMFSHDMKINDIAKTFLDEGGENLADIKYYECMLAHLHSESVRQDKNLTIRRLPTTSPSSTWANDSNFGSKRMHLSFIYNSKNNISDCLYILI